MAALAADAALPRVGFVFAPLFSRYSRCPEPIEPGEDARRLFDIVGLDEGTCGRRPGLLKPLGSGRSANFKPFLMDPGRSLSSRGSSYVSKTQTHQIVIFVQERLPEMPVFLSLIPAGV